MSCDSHALKKLRANACTGSLGKAGDAETSFTRHSRKPEHQAPPLPQYDRLEAFGKVALFINEGSGWMVHTAEGVFYNPWTHFPFNELRHAKSAIKARFKFGRWPGKKRQPVTKTE